MRNHASINYRIFFYFDFGLKNHNRKSKTNIYIIPIEIIILFSWKCFIQIRKPNDDLFIVKNITDMNDKYFSHVLLVLTGNKYKIKNIHDLEKIHFHTN